MAQPTEPVDLVVDLAAVREAAGRVQAVARRCAPVGPQLDDVALAVRGGELAGAAQDLTSWGLDVQELCARVIGHAAAAVEACEALVAVDRGACR
jgi:hypothetical protein